jgi:hypothetical protein
VNSGKAPAKKRKPHKKPTKAALARIASFEERYEDTPEKRRERAAEASF